MPTTSAISAQGSVLKIKVGNAFVLIKGVTDYSGLGGGSATVIDITDLSSTRKEKTLGLQDEGQIKISLNYIPDDPGQVALEAARDTNSKTSFQLILPDSTQWAFDALVPTFDKSGGVDKQVTASSALEITGPVVKSKAV